MAKNKWGLGKWVRPWLLGKDGDMVWNGLVVITVLVPLLSLCIDVPRYFTLRSRLQLAVDGAAQAATQCIDFPHFQNTGEVRLLTDCVARESTDVFAAATQDLQSKGYQPMLGAVSVDESADQVTIEASGTASLFFGLTPRFPIHASVVSSYRMEQR